MEINQLTNSDIAEIIELYGKLLDLHDIDPKRAQLYIGAVFPLERLDKQISGMSDEEIKDIRMYGPVLLKPVREILNTGQLSHLEELIAATPAGLFDVLKIKGLGIKKVKTLWKDLGIEDVKSLKVAAENGTIAQFKGFGEKTQQSILASIAFLENLKGKVRLNTGLELSHQILVELKRLYPQSVISGEMQRIENYASELSFLVIKDTFGGVKLPEDLFTQDMKSSTPTIWRGHFNGFDIPVVIEKISSKDFVSKSIIRSAVPAHLTYENAEGETLLSFLNKAGFETEEQAYQAFGTHYIIPEMRNGLNEFEKKIEPEEIISWEAIKGALHNHSTYSDGKNTLSEMAEACQKLGFEYFGIADHSQTASYANGLWPETIIKQHREIDELNQSYTDGFKILKGIESDILGDGSLDYPEEILKSFDYIVASVHSVLNMDLERATDRLIKAIENPYTSILGHPTGRLLLRREGYPIDYKKIIDACAANGVIMELNASPWRLDIDWHWINYCLEKEVMISINPDAHQTDGLLDIQYGVMIARKAGLPVSMTLNAQPLSVVLNKFRK